MRNCYVYKCDWKHKDNPKRAMFILPKDPEKFKLWSKVLPKHRTLTHHDRVCEKHFEPEDIMRDWTHFIQGQTRKVLRCKPNLRPDAVPSRFELTESELNAIARKRRKKEPPGKSECKEMEQEIVTEIVTEEHILLPSECEQESSERSAIFEELYENIFEVELPSTLWGVHRDPERNYIAFTRFQLLEAPDVTTSSTLLIESSLNCRAWCDSKEAFNVDLYPKMKQQPDGEDQLSRFQVIGSVIDSLEDPQPSG